MFFLSTGPLCAGLFYVNLLEAALSFITDSFYKLFEPLKSTVSRNAQVEPDEDIATVHAAYQNYALERVGGVKAIEGLPDAGSAQLLMDTLVRNGAEGGSLIIRESLNKIEPDASKQLDLGPGRIGPQTWQAYIETMKDPAKRDAFIGVLGEKRLEKNPEDEDRIEILKNTVNSSSRFNN